MNVTGTTTVTTDIMSVFERQQERMKWQHLQVQQQSFSDGNDHQVSNMFSNSMQPSNFPGMHGNIKTDPGMENGWSDFSDQGCGDQFPPLMADQKILLRNSSTLSLSPKKRKLTHDQEDSKENGDKYKKIKGSITEENSKETSSKEKSKVTDQAKKQDFIHVRARRGQATDSHSLAERVRREKISERMKYLQDLVPGCDKVTGKAGMLEEIINYVQCLQKQVEFLSMKLASLHPRLDFDDNDTLFTKEMFEVSAIAGYSSEMANSTYFQLNSLLEMGNYNPIEMMLRRNMGGPVSIAETLVVSSCANQMQPSVTWDGDLQNFYKMEFQQGAASKIPPYQPHKFTGMYEGSNLKMEM